MTRDDRDRLYLALDGLAFFAASIGATEDEWTQLAGQAWPAACESYARWLGSTIASGALEQARKERAA